MHDVSLLQDVLILLAAAVVIVAGFRWLNMSPVLGYLVAGAMIGPSGLAIIRDVKATSHIAEVGIIFLLFIIGLELSFDRLRDMRRHIFGLGSAQLLGTGLLLAGFAWLWSAPVAVAAVLGLTLALSSTAVVLQVVQEQGNQATLQGRLALAILLMQDFAVIPLLVLIPLLQDLDASFASILGMTLLKAVGALVGIFIVGHLLLRPLFRVVAATHNPELFVACTLLIVLGTAFATEAAGLSLALGAFVAGLLVAETEYEHQVEADILPFKGLFLGLFFMSVGMSVDVDAVLHFWPRVLGGVVALILLKAVLLYAVCRVFHIRRDVSVETALLLAQGGELAFILFSMMTDHALVSRTTGQLLMVVVTITMALTPLMSILGRRLGQWVASKATDSDADIAVETRDLDQHVILVGFGPVGRTIAMLLAAERKYYVAVDLDPAHVADGRAQQQPVYYGDIKRAEVLSSIRAKKARVVVFTHENTADIAKAAEILRRNHPQLKLLARAKDRKTRMQLEQAGVHAVVEEGYEAGLHMGAALLKLKGIPDSEVARAVGQLRAQTL